jgi:hypothetical protein
VCRTSSTCSSDEVKLFKECYTSWVVVEMQRDIRKDLQRNETSHATTILTPNKATRLEEGKKYSYSSCPFDTLKPNLPKIKCEHHVVHLPLNVANLKYGRLVARRVLELLKE